MNDDEFMKSYLIKCEKILEIPSIDLLHGSKQPERSKREDLFTKLCDAHQDIEFIVNNCPCDVCMEVSKMRCSEHDGNAVRDK